MQHSASATPRPPSEQSWALRSRPAALAANTAVFYVVKSAMEYSKSPRTPPQFAVGLLCNLFRHLNNIHPLVPPAFIASLLAALGWAIAAGA